MRRVRARLSYANVMSTLAVFLLLGGAGAVAANRTLKIGTRQLKGSAVTAAKIKNGAVLNSKLAAGAVSNDKIADGAVNNSKLTGDAVTTDVRWRRPGTSVGGERPDPDGHRRQGGGGDAGRGAVGKLGEPRRLRQSRRERGRRRG